MAHLTIRPLGYSAGAEVSGIDLRRALQVVHAEEIRMAWLKHLVLVFPGQELGPEEQICFAKNFGEVERNELRAGFQDADHPEILPVTNRLIEGKPSDSRNTGRNWHTDLAHTTRPAKASLLHCKEKPIVGGDTMFANMYLSYETLSAPMRRLVDSVEAIHDVMLTKGLEARDAHKVAELRRLNPPVIHPLVRTHPESGRKSLLVGQRIRGLVGMSDEESAAILSFLNNHATSPEFVYRHRWSVGDLVMWDNRCTMHIALPDFEQTQIRHMVRCSIIGEETGRLSS